MNTQAQIRRTFWATHPDLDAQARKHRVRSKPQNEQNTDCRVAFTDYVDQLARNGEISEALAARVTL